MLQLKFYMYLNADSFILPDYYIIGTQLEF